MTVKDLREALKSIPANTLVVMSKDSEGNNHSPLSAVEQRMYRAETTWSGDVKMPIEELTDEARDVGFSYEDVGTEDDGFVPAVVLCPVN